MRNNKGLEEAKAFAIKNPGTKASTLQDKFKISRASSYNVIKNIANKPEQVVEQVVPKKVRATRATRTVNKPGESKPKKTQKGKAKKTRKQWGVIPMDEIPEALRKRPSLSLDGFAKAVKKSSMDTPGDVDWSNKVYVGACNCCLESVNMFKAKSGSEISYTGRCDSCKITMTISM